MQKLEKKSHLARIRQMVIQSNSNPIKLNKRIIEFHICFKFEYDKYRILNYDMNQTLYMGHMVRI